MTAACICFWRSLDHPGALGRHLLRSIGWETTIGAQKSANIHVGRGSSRTEFVAMREARDAQLDMPKLIIPSLQVTMRAGEVPKDEAGHMTLKIPINKL